MAFSELRTAYKTNRGRLPMIQILEGRLLLATVPFSAPIPIVEPRIPNPQALDTADFDADGDVDILVFGGGNYELVWLENGDGGGNFENIHSIASRPGSGLMVDAVDLDGDGDIDVLASDYVADQIIWYRNDEGAFSDALPFAQYTRPGDIDVGDIDRDGDVDVVVVSPYTDDITWFRNEAHGEFARVEVPELSVWGTDGWQPTDENGWQRVFAIDEFSTGIAVSDGSRTYSVDANTGQLLLLTRGHATATDIEGIGKESLQIAYADFRITDQRSFPLQAASAVTLLQDDASFADIDGDGDDELVFVRGANHEISWAEISPNDRGTITTVPVVENGVPFVSALKLRDVNGDGRREIVADSPVDGRVESFSVSHVDEFTVAPRTLSTVPSNPPFSAISFEVLDADGDGINEVMTPIESSGDSSLTSFDHLANAFRVDVDRDGADELIGVALRSFGEGSFVIWDSSRGTRTLVHGDFSESSNGVAADIDRDGDLDILVALNRVDRTIGTDSNLVWLENDGSGSFGESHFITAGPSGVRSVGAGDLDGDGDLDVFLASAYDGELLWYRNLGAELFSAHPIIIATGIDLPRQLLGTDLDLDGDLDLVSRSSRSVYWYQNRGDGQFENRYRIGKSPASTVAVTDIDEDGDDDVLVSDRIRGTIHWYRNDATRGEGASELRLDFNGDRVVNARDVDLVCSAINKDEHLAGADLDRDGIVSMHDMSIMLRRELRVRNGDVTLDQLFDSSDLVHVFRAAEYEDELEDNSLWSEGDWNCDGEFTSRDLVLAFKGVSGPAESKWQRIRHDGLAAVRTAELLADHERRGPSSFGLLRSTFI